MTYLRTFFIFLLFSNATLIYASDETSSDTFLGLANISQVRTQDHTLEFWGYHDLQTPQNYVDTLKLRYYNPLNIGDWHGKVRLDMSYTAAYGPFLPAQSTGTFSPNNAMITIWGGEADWLANFGARLLAPLSNSGQWLAGPQVSSSFKPADSGQNVLADISPLARYMLGFHPKAPAGFNSPALVSRLELYPTVGLNLSPSTQIRFWDENGAIYNAAAGGWFIPIDAMLTQRINKNLLVAVGGAKQIVQSYQLYNWSIYGKI